MSFLPRLLGSSLLLFLATLVFALPVTAAAQDTSPPSSAALIELLKNESARNALIADLERVAATDTSADTPISEDALSIGRQVAEMTQGLAERTAQRIMGLWDQLMGSGSVFSGLTGAEIMVLTDAFTELGLVLVLTISIFIALRQVAIPFYKRMGSQANDCGIFRTGLLFSGSALIDVVVVVIAWAIGYAVTLVAVGDLGQIGLRQTLYLNAFLAVELIKVGLRGVLSPTTPGLRPLPLSDAAARTLSRHANAVVSVLGYGHLLVVPIINQNAGLLAGRGVSVLLSVLVLLHLVTLVLRKRAQVSTWLLDRLSPQMPVAEILAPSGPDDTPVPKPAPRKGVLPGMARNWHWGTLVYLLMMFVVVMTQPSGMVVSAIGASVKIALAVIAATGVSGFLSRIILKGVRLPENVTARLPLLEQRLNRFVPQTLLVLRAIMIGGVILFALDTSGAMATGSWLESDLGARITGTAFSLAFIGIVSGAIWLAMTAWVDYRLNPEYGNVPTARETTLLTLLRNAATITLLILTTMFCLSEIGLDIGPLLASAGVLGLAIGFGAQKMVQDIITGIFIQFENAINVGDVVTVGGITGGVEKLTVRSVSLRDIHGVFHIIPFSSVDAVSNFTRDFSYFVADMGVAYRENVEEVKKAMFDGFEELRRDPDHHPSIKGDLEWMGLNSFGNSAVILRARIKTLPGKQWGMGRAYNAILKRIFDERGIEIPFPHQTIFFGEAKDGSLQAKGLLESPRE